MRFEDCNLKIAATTKIYINIYSLESNRINACIDSYRGDEKKTKTISPLKITACMDLWCGHNQRSSQGGKIELLAKKASSTIKTLKQNNCCIPFISYNTYINSPSPPPQNQTPSLKEGARKQCRTTLTIAFLEEIKDIKF